jgi:hypothetical protein
MLRSSSCILSEVFVNRVRDIAGVLAVLALVVCIASFVVAGVLSNGSSLVQLIQPEDAAVAGLFAEEASGEPTGTKLGSPQVMVIRDQQAFLEGTGAQGERFVSQKYLDEKQIYPLQVKTILFFRNITALISALGAVLMGGLWFWSRSRIPVRTHRA